MSPLNIVLVILGVTILAFITGKLPYTVIAIGIISSLLLTHVMDIKQAFCALTDKNVIMLAAMFVISAGIVKSGILDHVKD
ncbi:SLC13 family permease [Acidaminococcus sp.]|uniref:SLC13 family permease n=1 Tax=Acidaminococcus sp. TaxID=1872103 RepID=UPI003D7DF697